MRALNMKTILLIVFCLFSDLIYSQTKIEFYNNSGNEIYACYAYFDQADQSWTTLGWYKLPPYDYSTIDIGNYYGTIYLRGRQGLLKEWGNGDANFCVDAERPFKIKFADKKDCWSKKAFSEFKVRPGINKWTFL
jgi:uncharacterized membrane protein